MWQTVLFHIEKCKANLSDQNRYKVCRSCNSCFLHHNPQFSVYNYAHSGLTSLSKNHVITYDSYSMMHIIRQKKSSLPNSTNFRTILVKKNKIKNNLKNEFSDLKISKIRFYNHMSPKSI